MALDRVKISDLIPAQLPEFVRTEYQTFVAFIQAYYDYLDETGVIVDMDTIRDLDESVAEFVEHIKSEIAPKIPFDIANNRFKASHIRDLYDAKGSSSSFKLLFRMLYGRETDITYPGQQMLIPSDGRWVQPFSIFVRFSEQIGDPAALVGKLININSGGTVIQVFVEKIDPVLIYDDNKNLIIDPNTFQININKNYFGKINVGDAFKYVGDSMTFVGEIVPSTVKITVTYGGKGFKIGELYSINTSTGTGAVLKITKVDSEGSILQSELISAGINYVTSYTTSLFAKSIEQSSTAPGFSTSYSAGTYNLQLVETTDPLSDYGIITKYDYTSNLDVWDNSYVGQPLGSFFDVGTAIIVDDDSAASIEVLTGPVVKFPGYFSTNSGFLSDAMFIQDSKYYQVFSYVVKLDRTLDDYSGVLKSLLHPAGTALFGEFNLDVELDMSFEVEAEIITGTKGYLYLDGSWILDGSELLNGIDSV